MLIEDNPLPLIRSTKIAKEDFVTLQKSPKVALLKSGDAGLLGRSGDIVISRSLVVTL